MGGSNAVVTGIDNVAIGGWHDGVVEASLAALTSGSQNIGLGVGTLRSLATGNGNTALGFKAGKQLSGSDNTCLGAYSGENISSGVQNVLLGKSTQPADSTHSNTIVIGSNMTGKGANTGFISPNSGPVYQGNNASTWSQTSDERLKKNITTNTEGLSKINGIVVRNFEYKTVEEVESDGVLEGHTALPIAGQQLGVIAQELATVVPSAVFEESTGVKSVQSGELQWYMINAIKELSATVQTLTTRIEELEGE